MGMVDTLTNCRELFVLSKGALDGIAMPSIPTTVAACDPVPGPTVTSPVSWFMPDAVADITPALAVMVVPSTLAKPNTLLDASGFSTLTFAPDT